MRPRGFTLVELLMTAAVASIAIAAAFGSFIAQHRTLQGQEASRHLQQSMRATSGFLERVVRRAGWGIEPFFALDFDRYPAQPCNGPAVCPRDSTTGPDSLVFYARNPFYVLTEAGTLSGNAWEFLGATETDLKIEAREGDTFAAGQILMVMCSDATASAFVTLQSGAVADADGELFLSLRPGVAGDPFLGQSLLESVECFEAGAGDGTAVFLLDRYHLFVRSYRDGASHPIPWLMLDTGTDTNGDAQVDENDWLPVVEGVEDLQISYLMNSSEEYAAPDSDGDWIFGNAEGVQEEPDRTAVAPRYAQAVFAPERYTGHPANVRAMRIGVTLRSRADADDVGTGSEAPARWGNRSESSLPEADKFRRLSFSLVVNTPNMASRAQFLF